MLDENGDVVIKNHIIQMVENTDLIKQTVRTVLSTNKNEWFLNIDEGINFDNLLGKKKSDEIIRNEILLGLQQIDESFVIEKFNTSVDRGKREMTITFTATNSSNQTVNYSEVI